MKWVLTIDVFLIVVLIAEAVLGYVSIGELVIVLMLMRIFYAVMKR